MMDVSCPYSNNHCTLCMLIHLNQTITLYALNLYSDYVNYFLMKQKKTLFFLLYETFHDIYWIIIHIRFYFIFKIVF